MILVWTQLQIGSQGQAGLSRGAQGEWERGLQADV